MRALDCIAQQCVKYTKFGKTDKPTITEFQNRPVRAGIGCGACPLCNKRKAIESNDSIARKPVYSYMGSSLSNEKDTRALDVLYYQLEHCRKYIPNFDSRKSIDVQLQEAREMNQKEYGNIDVIVQSTDIEK